MTVAKNGIEASKNQTRIKCKKKTKTKIKIKTESLYENKNNKRRNDMILCDWEECEYTCNARSRWFLFWTKLKWWLRVSIECWSWTDKPAKPARFNADEFYIYKYIYKRIVFRFRFALFVCPCSFVRFNVTVAASFFYFISFRFVSFASFASFESMVLLLSFPIYSLYLG